MDKFDETSSSKSKKPKFLLGCPDFWIFFASAFVLFVISTLIIFFTSSPELEGSSLRNTGTLLFVITGVFSVCSILGGFHYASSFQAAPIWLGGSFLSVLAIVVSLIGNGFILNPLLVFGVFMLPSSGLGFFLGKKADTYISQFPKQGGFFSDSWK